MKQMMKLTLCAITLATLSMPQVKADWTDLLGNLGNVVSETVAQNTAKNLTVADIEGTWQVTGPGVVLKSENVLEQAGGAALTASAEEKLLPYYQRFGVIGATMTFDKDGNFTLHLKWPVNGTIAKNEDGSWQVKLGSSNGLGKISSSSRSMTAYVQKSNDEMTITVDVKKVVEILKKVTSKKEQSMLNSALSMIENYDHVCMGFRMKKIE